MNFSSALAVFCLFFWPAVAFNLLMGDAVDSGALCPGKLNVTGLILARGGSKGILLKNLATINGRSLLTLALEKMKHSKKFREIWVSTDSHMIANEATKCGAKVHWRSRMSATDTASSLVALQDFIKGHKEFDRIGLIQCTSPFLAVKYLNEAFEHLQQGYDSVFSVTREFKLRWKENRPEKTFVAVNFDPARRPRRQDWDGELVENGMFYFTRRHLISRGLIQGGRIGVVQVERKDSLEVDNPADLNLARYQSGDL